MRPISLLFAAALVSTSLCVALSAADPVSAEPPAGGNIAAHADAAPPAAAALAATATPAASTPAESSALPTADTGAPTTSAEQPATQSPAAETSAPPAPPQVVTAQIDPELSLRLSMLEKTMLAQSESQSAIYSETSRLLMFFGSACVGMGLLAMIAAVFLMNRTLASVSAITVQVARAQSLPALPSGAAALVPAAAPVTPATGFEKVQASGQRFQNRMTSLEQRLEELENLAGHATPAAGDTTVAAPADETDATVSTEPAPRRVIPLAAILVRKAEALMNLGKLNEAMTVLDEASRHEGDPTEIHLARGRVLEKLGRLGDALQSYDLATNTDQTNTAALLMKAGVLNRQERFEEALNCYERALAVHKAAN